MKKNQIVLLFLVLLLASVLRLYNLGQMPYGITNDEAGYLYSAYSISQTLKDVNGKFLPLSFNLENPFSPVPIYLNAIFIKILGLSVFTGRFFYAVLGVGCVLLVFLLANQFFRNNKIALLSALVLAISPWHLHISRSAYEAGVALFFFLLAFLLFLKNAKRGNINWSLPFFALAFYSYHATKIFFLPFIFVLLLTHKGLLKKKKELTFFIAGIVMIVLSFLYVGKKQAAFGRATTFLFNDMNTASRVVDEERLKSGAPFIIRQVFNNKPLYFLRVMRENYLKSFSPQYLFLYGETSGLAGIYGTFLRGEMYINELFFLIYGAFILWQKYKNVRGIIFLSLLAAPLTTTLTSDATYVMRAVMMIPFLCLIVGLGIFSFISFISKYSQVVRRIVTMVLVSWYLFLVTSYLYQYHFRYSIYGAEYWFRSSRELATLIRNEKDKYDRVDLVEPGQMFILQYGVFANVEAEKIQKTWSEKTPKQLENINFLDGCIDVDDESLVKSLPPKTLNIVPEKRKCHRQATPSAVIKEFGEPLRNIWKIYSTE